MKTKFVVILVIAEFMAVFVAGWFAKGYYDGKQTAGFIADMQQPQETHATLYPVRIDPVDTTKFMDIISDLTSKLKASLSNNTVVLEPTDKEPLTVGIKIPEPVRDPYKFKTYFEYEHLEPVGGDSIPMFKIFLTSYAPCPVTKTDIVAKADVAYINEIIRNSQTVTTEYPWYGKVFWIGTGVLVGYMATEWTYNLRHNRTLK